MKKSLFSKFQDAELNKKAMAMVDGGAIGETEKSKSTNSGKDCTDPDTALNKDNVGTSTEFDTTTGS